MYWLHMVGYWSEIMQSWNVARNHSSHSLMEIYGNENLFHLLGVYVDYREKLCRKCQWLHGWLFMWFFLCFLSSFIDVFCELFCSFRLSFSEWFQCSSCVTFSFVDRVSCLGCYGCYSNSKQFWFFLLCETLSSLYDGTFRSICVVYMST